MEAKISLKYVTRSLEEKSERMERKIFANESSKK